MTIAIEAASKAIGGLQILRDITLEIPAGRLTGLIGPNGAGKSTLFAAIGGSIALDAGRILFNGEAIDQRPTQARAEAGLIRTFQVPRPFRHLSVRDNLAAVAPGQSGERLWGALIAGKRRRREQEAITARADEIMSFLDLSRVADAPASQLSGGQRKLLELGRALMVDPQMVLLDEPFAGVNPVLFEEISDRIRQLNRRGIGFFIVEHNIAALARIVSHLYVLDHGRLLAGGEPDAVLARSDVRQVYMGGVL